MEWILDWKSQSNISSPVINHFKFKIWVTFNEFRKSDFEWTATEVNLVRVHWKNIYCVENRHAGQSTKIIRNSNIFWTLARLGCRCRCLWIPILEMRSFKWAFTSYVQFLYQKRIFFFGKDLTNFGHFDLKQNYCVVKAKIIDSLATNPKI
jgi:hypothetical protein